MAGILLLDLLICCLPVVFVAAFWWLASGAKRSPWKRGILAALSAWALIGAWQWYQCERNRIVFVCVVDKKDVERARPLWRQHGLAPKLDCHAYADDYTDSICTVSAPLYQANLTRMLVPDRP